jgi:hypothetical protein
MSTHYFSCSGGPDAVSIKSGLGHNASSLCFCVWWDLWVTQCILVRLGYEMLTHYFSFSGGIVRFPKKVRRDMLQRTCVFASGGICG